MCIPHVINICAQHAIKVLDDGEIDDAESDADDDLEAASTPAKPKGLLAKVGRSFSLSIYILSSHSLEIRAIVRFIRASDQRIEAFEAIIENGNENDWWHDEQDKVIRLPVRKLLRDVRTRWDSTFQMLRRVYELKEVHIHSLSTIEVNLRKLIML